jgi:YfiR/HmsC-like
MVMETNRNSGITQRRTQRALSRIWWIATAAAIFAWVCIGTVPSAPAQDGLPEYQVKAAYLFNFLKFVEWPSDAYADSMAPMVIGVVGDDPFGSALPEVVIGKTVQGRDLVIRKYHQGENLRGATILFISESEKKRLPQILAGLRGSSVLTVSDMDGFLDGGGMIQFLIENDRVRFGIDVGATARAKLKVSSKLLSLARTVTDGERVGNN